MPSNFKYDVFLSHSSKDKTKVQKIAERLNKDGINVWFDEWQLKPGVSIPANIEEGLENSRTLALFMSENSFGSDWAQLEAGTFRFRDPLNKNRRFIPVRLDQSEIKGSLQQFFYIDLTVTDLTPEYNKLLEACKPTIIKKPATTENRHHKFLDKIHSLGHTNYVYSVAFSPDGYRAISGSRDSTLRLWDVETGNSLRVFEGHTDLVNSVAFSPDGSHAISASDDNTLRLWDVETGNSLRVFEGHTDGVYSVAFSPDGLRAISASVDKTLRLWDVETGKSLRVFEGHTGYVNSVAFSPDGTRAISASVDKTLRLWDVETGKSLRVFEGHTGYVNSVAFSPDGTRAISASRDHTLRLWDVETGNSLRVFEGHTYGVNSVAFSPDGLRAISASVDRTLRLWDVETGNSLRVFEGHTNYVNSVAFSPDGLRAISASVDHTLRLWDVETGNSLRVFEGHTYGVNSVAFSPDGLRAISASVDRTLRLWDLETGNSLRVFEGHTDYVNSVAFSPDGTRAISASVDHTLRLWDVETGNSLRVFEGHTDLVIRVAFSPDGTRAISASVDHTLRLWDVETGNSLRMFEGHTDYVNSVAFSPDGTRAISASDDHTLRLWDVETGNSLRVFEGHTGYVYSVAFSPDGYRAISASVDKTLRLWDVETGKSLRVFEGHTGYVNSVAFSPDGTRAISASRDHTLRLWDVETGNSLRVFEGHTDGVNSVVFSPDGTRAISASRDHTLRLWDVETGNSLRVFEGHTDLVIRVAFSPDGSRVFSASVNNVLRVWTIQKSGTIATKDRLTKSLEQVQYTNAKVLLVGNTSAGKTGLTNRLARNLYEETDSTVGAWATQWKIDITNQTKNLEREIWLWDFGGQADQRLIHQLYMAQTQVAVLVFDPQKKNLFEDLAEWDRDLSKAASGNFQKLLVAGRIDAGGLRHASRNKVENFAVERGFAKPLLLETSAKENIGCEELKKAIVKTIQWDNIEQRTSPVLFKRLKDEIIKLKDENRVLLRFNELREALTLRLSGENNRFTDAELQTVISLLAGPGAVWELEFGSWVLLQPELINAYAQAVIRTITEEKNEMGCIAEAHVLNGELAFPSNLKRLPAEEERILLLAMHQILVEHGLCLREPTKTGALLIFPSYARIERPDLVEHPSVIISYSFEGFLDDIYATLVVRLQYTSPFNVTKLWKGAADFKTTNGKKLGVKLIRKNSGKAELLVYFDPDLPIDEMMTFSKYVHEHILRKANNREEVKRLRHWVCKNCGEPVENRDAAMRRISKKGKEAKIICVECEQQIILWDELEEKFADPVILARVRELEKQSDFELDAESKDRALVGEVTSTVALAGQIFREVTVSDHGIDGEIEFKDDNNNATGYKLYLQLKSGDSHLNKRKNDNAEIFTIKKQRHVNFWMKQAFPVMLVIRNSKGETRWMEIRDLLIEEIDNGKKQVKQIVFKGERFDVMSIRRWRDRMLHPGNLQTLQSKGML